MDAALRHTGCVHLVLRNHISFNPCFSGCRPATVLNAVRRVIYLRFNPCFSGCRPATNSDGDRERDLLCVSILVLVDAALRPSRPEYTRISLCFNPCFSGCRPATSTRSV